MKRDVSVVRFNFRCNILISGKMIKELPVSVASGTHCIYSCIQDLVIPALDTTSLSHLRIN